MKLFNQSILTISVLSLAVLGLVGKAHAAQDCGGAITLEARLAADDDTGADPDLMTEECMADYSSIKSIGQNQYSVLVDCPDTSEMMYDVTVSQDGGVCRGIDATQDKSYKPAN
jgi:hypothetical protein